MEKETIEKINQWKNYEKLDSELKEELKNYNNKELEEAFCKNLNFGTGGIRTKMGPGINRLNIYTIRKISTGYAKYITKNYKNPSIVIAYDNRKNSYKFAVESMKIFAKHKIQTYLFESLRPTPELSFAIRELKASGGIVITASHNSKEYNGYKIYDLNGCQTTDYVTKEIKKEIDKIKEELNIELCSLKESAKYIKYIGRDIDESYYKNVLNIQINKNIDKSNLKVIFTPQHGTSHIPINRLLKELGYKIINVQEQSYPDPYFTNTISPNPEKEEAFFLALEYAKKYNGDIIISTDPDSDRLGLIVKHKDNYKFLTANQIGAIILEYILKNTSDLKNKIIYNTIVTSDLGKVIASNYGVEVFSTLTGFKYIGEQINLNNKEFLFGYEESNGFLIKDFTRDKDAIQTTILLCEIANFYKNQNLTLIDILEKIYKKYGYFYDKQDTIKYEEKRKTNKINDILNQIRNNKIKLLKNYNIEIIEDYSKSKKYINKEESFINLPKSNVLKFIFEDKSWIAIRPSGTEPITKIYYCIKGKTKKETIKKYNEIKENIDKYLK